MMKKRFLASFILFSTLALTSCGGEKHSHSFAEEWEFDTVNHWHECECGEKSDLAAHVWGEGRVETPATCTTNGLRVYTCACGATKNEPILATDHNPDVEWQSGGGYHWHNCLNDDCYVELDKAACTYVEDTTKRIDSTCTTQGYKYSYCSVCEAEKVERLALAEHVYGAQPVEKVEPTCTQTGLYTYKCENCTATREEVIDAKGHTYVPQENDGEAFQYDSVGTWDECSVCQAVANEVITSSAPWAAFDLQNKNNITNKQDKSAWDEETHTLTTMEYELDKGVWFDLADIVKSDNTTNRLIIEVTATVTGEVSYGGQAAFQILNYEGDKIAYADILKQNPYTDVREFDCCKITALEGGVEITSLSSYGAEFTYRFDFRLGNKLPKTLVINGANGGGYVDGVSTQNKPDIITIKSIVAKETLCGHKSSFVELDEEIDSTCSELGYTSYVCTHADCDNLEYKVMETELAPHTPIPQQGADVAHGYEWGGEATVCSVCGTMLDDTNVVPAPWTHANVFSGDGSNISVENKKSTFDMATKTWTTTGDDYLVIKPIGSDKFKDFATRKYIQFTMTADVSGNGWGAGMFDLYVGANRTLGDKITTRNNSLLALGSSQGWESYAQIKEVLNAETGEDLTGKPFRGIKIKMILDASTITDLKNVWVGTSLSAVSVVFEDITFMDALCTHSNMNETVTGMQQSITCADCGKAVKFVNSLVVSAADGFMEKEENVTFDEREGCLKLKTLKSTSDSANSIYPVNFKMYYKGLVANARAAGRTMIELHVYIKATGTNNDVRFGWGVGNNKSGCQADHWNNPTQLIGGAPENVQNDSVITDESGTPTKLPANCWRVITVDVSDDFYGASDKADFFIIAPFDSKKDRDIYPIEAYISSIRCYAPTVSE